MSRNYIVRLSKVSKFHGDTSETFTSGLIHEEEYEFASNDYSEALKDYKKRVSDCAEHIAMGIVFSSCYTIQFIDADLKNPLQSFKERRRIRFQVTISNL